MTTAIISDEAAENRFNEIDINNILLIALQERDAIISNSPVLKEFQSDIDSTINGFKNINTRLESLAVAAKKFSIKRGIPERIAEFERDIMMLNLEREIIDRERNGLEI